MTADFDFYDLLDIPEDASQSDIKTAFRQKVRVYHPDQNDDDRAQAQFTAVKKAYDILGDPVERQAYDRLGHQDYVAKRTKGIPSPDLWKPRSASSESDEESDSEETKTSTRSSTTTSSRSGTSSSSTSTTSSAGSTESSQSTATSSSSSAKSTRSARADANATRTESTESTETAGAATGTTETASGGGVGSTDGGTTTHAHTHTGGQTRQQTTHSQPGPITNNPLTRWWKRQNFAWPLIWTSLFVYIAGLFHFGLENEGALLDIGSQVSTIGADPETLWAEFATGRHGVETPLQFVTGLELVPPPAPLETIEWYGVLAGLVGVAFLLVIVARIAWRQETWGPVSIDETIVVAIALSIVATVFGGPLLAGALLMPLLFGVVVHRTRQLPGWSPSYLYVLCVLAPGVGFLAAVAGYTSLSGDLFTFVLVPVMGALALPLRASIRKRFGR